MGSPAMSHVQVLMAWGQLAGFWRSWALGPQPCSLGSPGKPQALGETINPEHTPWPQWTPGISVPPSQIPWQSVFA